jgi:hypothetical protein
MTVPFIVCALITAISALVSFGYSMAAVLGSSGEAKTLARYASARSVALLIVSLVPFLTGFSPMAAGHCVCHDHRSGL